jgi:hypothetical protein
MLDEMGASTADNVVARDGIVFLSCIVQSVAVKSVTVINLVITSRSGEGV